MSQFVQYALLGAGGGSIYALISFGLILIYRSSGVINFAQGAFGLVGALTFWEVIDRHHWPLVLGIALGCVAASAAGLLGYELAIRPLQRATKLTQIIATLVLLIIVQAAAELRYPGTYIVAPIFPERSVKVVGTPVPESSLCLAGIAITTTIVLWLAYRFTRFGAATTAVAESEENVQILGRSPHRVAALNWSIGGGLSGLAAILIAPSSELNVSQVTVLLVPALSVAVIGLFQSFPIALAAGLLLGLFESDVQHYAKSYTVQSVATALPFLVVAIALVGWGRRFPERALPRVRLPAIGSGRIRWGAVLPLAAVGFIGLFSLSPTWASAAAISMGGAVVALSVVLVTGYSGQLSLAQYALAGLAVWTTAKLVTSVALPFELAAVLAVVAAGAAGAAVGFCALRVRGAMLGVVTLAVAAGLDALIFQNSSWGGGLIGISVGKISVLGSRLDRQQDPERYAAVCLAGFCIVALALANVRQGRLGRRLLAVRANERAAAAMGISVAGAKLYAFVLGAAIAALGGILFAFGVPNLDFSSSYSPLASILIIAYTVVGGLGYIAGTLTAAILMPGGIGTQIGAQFGSNWTNWLQLGAGIVILAQLVAAPDGGVSSSMRLVDRLSHRYGWIRSKRVEPEQALSSTEEVSPVPAASLHVNAVSVRFGGVRAVKDASFTVSAGEIVGLIGPNGAGKTTLIDAISGFIGDYSGTVRLGETILDGMTAVQRAREGISRSFQSLELIDDLTVTENLLVASEGRDRSAYVAGLVRPGSRQLTEHAKAAAQEFQIGAVMNVVPDLLPYGTRHLVAIARAVAAWPSILLLDEPAAGLDSSSTARLGQSLRRLASTFGIGILLVEHDLDLVLEICDRVVVLDSGQVIAVGEPLAVRNDPLVVAAYLGTDADVPPQDMSPASAVGSDL